MKKLTDADREKYRTQLLMELTQHVGSSRIIGMGELYEVVFGKSYQHRINDTRPLRTLITDLRRNGVRICEERSSSGAGYYLASSTSELNRYCQRRTNEALRILAMISKMRKISLPALIGQLILEFPEGETDEKESDARST